MSLSSIFQARKKQQQKAFYKEENKQNFSKKYTQQPKNNDSQVSKPLFEISKRPIEPITVQPPALLSKKPQEDIEEKNHTKQSEENLQKNLERTIFVGNVLLGTKHKQLQAHFKKYGEVQSIWFRSIPVEPTKMGRKAAHILKKYVEGADSMNGYVRFVDKESTEKAIKGENGQKFKNLTIRVTMCGDKKQDTETSVFVGNLPHNITENEFREHFETNAPHLNISSVRLIKSRQTNLGIGIGYVQFNTKEEMKQAIKVLNGTQLKGREIRVKKAVAKERLQKKTNKIMNKYGNKNGKTTDPQKAKSIKAVEARQRSKQIKEKRNNFKQKKIKK